MFESRHLAPIPRTTVTEEISKRLLALVLEEGLRPGDKLPSERALMTRLAVGRSSLREAIKALSALGLVRIAPGVGAFVSAGDIAALARPLSWSLLMSEQSAHEVIEARRTIETEMAGLAAERATAADLSAIAKHLEAMRASVRHAEEFSRHDVAFHLAIASAARNQVLLHILTALRGLLHIWIVRVQTSFADPQQGFAGHEPIYLAIRERDAAAARQAMTAHLNAAGAQLLTLVAGAPDGDRLAQETREAPPAWSHRGPASAESLSTS